MNLPVGITKVVKVRGIRGPAKVNPQTGVVFVNLDIWHKLDKDVKFYILCHEAGHLNAYTSSESKADEWAFNYFVKHRKNAQKCVESLTSLLNPNNPEHALRISLQKKRVEKYLRSKTKRMNNLTYPLTGAQLEELFLNNELHFGGRGRIRRAARKENRATRREERAERRNERKATRGARKSPLNTVSQALSPEQATAQQREADPETKKPNTILYAAIGVAVVSIIAAIYFISKK